MINFYKISGILISSLVAIVLCLYGSSTLHAQDRIERVPITSIDSRSTYTMLSYSDMMVPLEEALKKIEKTHRITFLYDSDLFLGKYIPKEYLQSDSLEYQLGELLNQVGLTYKQQTERSYVISRMVDWAPETEQDVTITGHIADAETGESIPGVNVMIRGTSEGTVTNTDGEFELVVPDLQQVLVISYVGYDRLEIPLDGRVELSIELVQSVSEMDELVVTAFGITRERRSLGYSTQSVSTENLVEARETNVIRNLRGRVAGAEITQSPVAGGSSGILLRGVGSITGDNMPLIVVDGVPIDNSQTQAPDVGWGGIDYGDGIGGVRADDIEEITVLKGPNASALYGARASNGVLLITTKTGESRSGIGVDFNSNITFDQIGMKPQFQNRWASGYGMNWDDAWNTVEIDGQRYYEFGGGTDSHGPELDGRMIVLRHRPDLGPVPATPQPKDNIYDFYNTGITANNAIAFSGGNENTTYRVSFTDERNEGVVPKSQFNSNSVSLRVTSNITERLRVDGRANYFRHEGTNRPGLGGQLAQNTFLNLQMTARFVDLKWLEDYKGPDGRPLNVSSRYPSNPYWMVNERQNNDTRDRVYGFISASYDFADWLNLKVRAGTDTYLDQRFMRAALFDPGDLDGRIENRAFRVQENNYDFLFNAMGNLTRDVTGSLSFGGNYLSRRNEQTGVVGTQLNIPGLYHINNANSRSTIYDLSEKEMQSLYAMGQIGYQDIVYLDLSARNDWSSTLGRGNESFFYPSASLALVLSDALNIQSSVLTIARLRASYAETGNDTYPYRTKSGYFLDSTDFDGIRMAGTPGTIPLVDLKNELTKSWEFGADIVLFDNRLSFDIAAYSASTFNQIFSVPVSTTTGYGSRLINAGQIDNKGIELTVDSRIVQTTNFAWNLAFNLARNRNMVVELAPGVEAYNIASGGQVTAQARPGEPYGDLWGWAPDYTEDGRMILNENGTLRRSSEQSVLGNMQPDFTGGITNQITYKGFSLGAVLDFRVGGDLVSMSMREGLMKGAGIHTQHREEEMYHDGVIPVYNDAGEIVEYKENDQPVDPIGYYPARVWGQMANFWIVSGTYMSLNEMTLGYSFSPSFLSTTPLTGLRVSVVGRNLGYLVLDDDLRLMGVPPLSSNSRSPAGMGFEENNFPLLRSIGFNVNVQF